MALSELAQQLLQLHAGNPNRLFYGIDVLGSFYREADIDRLDNAYRELADMGLFLDTSSAVVSFFGVPCRLYKINTKGLERITQESRA